MSSSSSIVLVRRHDRRHVFNVPDYDPFVEAAVALGGNQDGERWTFDLRDEQHVRDLLLELFGVDGSGEDVPTVDIRVDVNAVCIASETAHVIYAFGRELARRPARDRAVMLGSGVSVAVGGFPPRGGSVKYPSLWPCAGTVLEVRDVPASFADRLPPWAAAYREARPGTRRRPW